MNGDKWVRRWGQLCAHRRLKSCLLHFGKEILCPLCDGLVHTAMVTAHRSTTSYSGRRHDGIPHVRRGCDAAAGSVALDRSQRHVEVDRLSSTRRAIETLGEPWLCAQVCEYGGSQWLWCVCRAGLVNHLRVLPQEIERKSITVNENPVARCGEEGVGCH